MEWIKTKDELPAYGEPVLLCISWVVQNVTYVLDGCDDSGDWFEPYHFEHEDDDKLPLNKVSHWAHIPDAPEI